LAAVRAFIVHLERAERRRPQVDALLRQLPMPAEIVDAVDGLKLSPEEAEAVYRRRLHRPTYAFRLLDTEIACFLSHRKAWQAIVDSGVEAGLVIEDDVAVDPRFAEVVTFAGGVAGARDYVRFPRWERGEDGETVHRSGDMAIIEPFLPALGMQAELIGREAARLLLATTETFDRPVDSTVQMQWLHGARVLSARPIVVREIDRELGGTVLQNKKMSLLEWMAHEVRRPLSRAAIVRRNRRWRKI
jgi:GR25 family glycosyltransferase involved in LPS biosynthesis